MHPNLRRGRFPTLELRSRCAHKLLGQGGAKVALPVFFLFHVTKKNMATEWNCVWPEEEKKKPVVLSARVQTSEMDKPVEYGPNYQPNPTFKEKHRIQAVIAVVALVAAAQFMKYLSRLHFRICQLERKLAHL